MPRDQIAPRITFSPEPSKARRDVAASRALLPACLALAILGLSVYLVTLPADLRNNADTVDRFFVTRSLVHSQRPIVACPAPNAPPLADTRLARGRHGCYYTIYGPGQSVAMAPLYAVGKAVSLATSLPADFAIAIAVRSLDPLLAALLLPLFFVLAIELGYTWRTGVIVTLTLAFASTLWPDVQSGQEHTQVTLALLLALCCAVRARAAAAQHVAERVGRDPEAAQDGRGRRRTTLDRPAGDFARWSGLCGAAAGLGFFTRYPFIIVVPIFGVYLLWLAGREPGRHGPGDWDERGRRMLKVAGAYIAGLAPFLLIVAGFDLWRYGAPWRTGESVSGQFGYPIWQGIPNLLISPGKGLIWYLPLIWLLPWAVGLFRRRAPDLVWLMAALVAVYVLFYANVIYWHGDPAWGPRYLYPVVPLLVLPLGEIVERRRLHGRGLQVASIAVLLISLSVQLAAVSVDPWRFWYHLIRDRERAGQTFAWGPRNYHYYWDAGHIPILYQFQALGDAVAIASGDRKPFIPEAHGCTTGHTTALSGVTCRPLNTISPIWLNDRYQWLVPLPVPLSLLARILIVGLLVLMGMSSALALWIQSRRHPPPDRCFDVGAGVREWR